MSLLEVVDLEARYGPVTVVHGVTFAVEEGQAVAMLGANGAGKTTTLRALSGLVSASGSAIFDGKQLIGRSPESVVRCGIAHVPEGRGTFGAFSVEDNLRLGAYTRGDRDAVREDIERCFDYFPRLRERRRQLAASLSGGEQQMLAIARGLMLRPRLMLLDEPSLGLAPRVTRELFGVLEAISQEQGTTMLIVEQNANLVLRFADQAYVLEMGRVSMRGGADDIAADEGLRRSYLGVA
jgi:branched-chain amino acid transport system ATP-binding protein